MKFFVFFSFFCSTIIAQTQFPKDYFRPPLDIPMQLAGNFGELRPNHFHAGFDFKTMQKEGLNVFAVADGYVSRIKISTFGNGKTIYITHPNGFTSVYAHLQKAVGSIQELITKSHYKEQSFEIELFLKPNELVVKKGQLIALSGNTGASEGPHLHFELRDSKTEFVCNPLLFGFDKNLKDTKRPSVSALIAYPLESSTIINTAKQPIALSLRFQKDGTYMADKVKVNGKLGFGISTDDIDDVSFNKNGVYKVETFLNGESSFSYQLDTYSFDDMRYINALIDYSRYKKSRQRVQQLFMRNKYGLSFIKTDESKGVINPTPNLDQIYRIEVSDFFENKTIINVPIQFDLTSPIIPAEPESSQYFIKASKDNMFEKDNMSVFFPAGTFYNDFKMNFDVKNNTLFLHEDTVPAHTNFTITINEGAFSKEERDKIFIGRIDGAKISYNTTYRKDSMFSTRVRTLGKYKLVSDTIAPKISIAKPIEGQWVSSDTLQLRISDSLSGIKSYNGFVNGKWVLFEYDNKTQIITHTFRNDLLKDGRNELKVVVVDNVGNTTIFETGFLRSLKK